MTKSRDTTQQAQHSHSSALSDATKLTLADAAAIRRVRQSYGRSGGIVLLRWPDGVQACAIATLARELDAYLVPAGSVLIFGATWREADALSRCLPHMKLFEGVARRADGKLCVLFRGPEAPAIAVSRLATNGLHAGAEAVQLLAQMIAQLFDARVGDSLDLQKAGDVLLVDEAPSGPRGIRRCPGEADAHNSRPAV